MATTTNYGWTTPDDTALVKDGASAIRTLGSSIDTTTKALNPSTTLGDIEYRSSTANTNTRLALGTAGQVLTVNSGATAPEWATSTSGGMTLISTTTLSGATVTISSIPQTYNSLFMVISGVTNATADGGFRLAPNGSTNLLNVIVSDSTTLSTNIADYLYYGQTQFTSRTSALNAFTTEISNYASATTYKPVRSVGGFFQVSARPFFSSGVIATTTAITSLVFSNSGGNLSTGTVLLYGVK